MALPNTNIPIGAPPLLWSDVKSAFDKINENFIALDLATGGSAVNLETLNTSVSPATDNDYNIGSSTKKWKKLYVSSFLDNDANQDNGLWLGSAQIKGIDSYVDLPAGSKVNGSLIIDPDKTFFKEIQVNGSESIVATQFSDSFNLLSGFGINLNVDSSGDSIEISNTGILSISQGTGMIISTVSGVSTITNDGVRSLQSTTSLPLGRTAGTGININGTKGDNLKITNTGVISISAGVGITVSTDVASGDVTITNSAPAVNAFAQVQVNGDSANRIQADAVSDVLNINSGQGITLTKNTGTDTLTITVDPVFDLKGSIFGDDSTKIVDAVENKVYAAAGFYGNLTGNVTGNVTGNADSATVATTIDITNTNGLTTVFYPTFTENRTTGQYLRGDIDLTYRTDTNTLTAGTFSGNLNGTANVATTVTLVATDSTAATHYITFVDSATGNENVRTDTSLTYNPSTNTLTAGTFATGSLTITGSTIGTTDSSGIIINELTTFNTDVTFENDINILQSIFVRGSRVILLNDFKSLVAASTSFADFQSRIAAL